MPTYRCRFAKRADALSILAVLEKVAPEIPVRLDTPERKEVMCKRIQAGCVSRKVWVALDLDNRIVGFLMAEPDRQALELSYGGVTPLHRGNHIFPKLVKKIMAKGVPLTATVKHSNKCDMLARLHKLGFKKRTLSTSLSGDKSSSLVDDQDELRWEPRPPNCGGW